MNFRFLKSIAFLASCSAMVSMYSCSIDEELGQEISGPQESVTKTIELTAEEFDAMVENVKNDKTVESYSVFDPSTMSSLRSDRDSYDPQHGPKMILTSLRGLELSGRLRNSLKGYIKDSNSSWYGWYIFDVDLNDGARGAYCYLAANFSTYDPYVNGDYGISSLTGYQYKPANKELVQSSTLYDFDCNYKTKKGGPIYLGINRVGRDGGTPITAMMIVSYLTKQKDNKVGSYKIDAGGMDLNKGAGGRYIYIFTKH